MDTLFKDVCRIRKANSVRPPGSAWGLSFLLGQTSSISRRGHGGPENRICDWGRARTSCTRTVLHREKNSRQVIGARGQLMAIGPTCRTASRATSAGLRARHGSRTYMRGKFNDSGESSRDSG